MGRPEKHVLVAGTLALRFDRAVSAGDTLVPRKPFTALLAVTLPLCLAGCGGWNDTLLNYANGRAPELPSPESDKVDGNYKGVADLVAAQSPACPGDSFGKIEIGDRTLYFAYLPNTMFIAPIRPDGSVYAVSGPAVLDGRLAGGRLAFTVRTPVCESHYNMRYVL
jgi:hypothetical protein